MSFRSFIKKNLALCLGLSVPVLLVFGFLAATIIPKKLATPPQFKVLFAVSQYNQGNTGQMVSVIPEVAEGKVVMRLTTLKSPAYENPRLMIYDAANDRTEEIAFAVPQTIAGEKETRPVAEAAKMKIDINPTAPDGYTIDMGGWSSGGLATDILIGGRSYGARLVKGSVAYKLPDGRNTHYGYNSYYNPRILGWVIEDSRQK